MAIESNAKEGRKRINHEKDKELATANEKLLSCAADSFSDGINDLLSSPTESNITQFSHLSINCDRNDYLILPICMSAWNARPLSSL